MTHSIIAFVVAVLLAVFNAPMTAYLFVPAFYIGREIAQAEYRYIEAHGGHRTDCPKMCAFYPSAWTTKGLIDWLLPLVLSILVWSIQNWTPFLDCFKNLF